MHILAFDFSNRRELEIRVMCREFLAFKYVLVVFLETNQMIIYIRT